MFRATVGGPPPPPLPWSQQSCPSEHWSKGEIHSGPGKMPSRACTTRIKTAAWVFLDLQILKDRKLSHSTPKSTSFKQVNPPASLHQFSHSLASEPPVAASNEEGWLEDRKHPETQTSQWPAIPRGPAIVTFTPTELCQLVKQIHKLLSLLLGLYISGLPFQ